MSNIYTFPNGKTLSISRSKKGPGKATTKAQQVDRNVAAPDATGSVSCSAQEAGHGPTAGGSAAAPLRAALQPYSCDRGHPHTLACNGQQRLELTQRYLKDEPRPRSNWAVAVISG
jgi:hypothetical protein